MANLLLVAANWIDNATNSPPACWDGTAYVAVNQEEDLTLTAAVSAGDVVACTLGSTDGIGTVVVRDSGGTVLATWGPVNALTSFSIPAQAGMQLQIDGGLGCASDTLTLTPTANPITYNCSCDDTTGNATLKDLRDRLMRRLGFGAQVNNPPPGMADLLNDFLQEAQRFLFRRYDVLRTERFYSWPLTAGVRMYDFADNAESCTKVMDPRKVTWVGVVRDGIWTPLECGIPPELYSNEPGGWPLRYEIRQCIEVWPMPVNTEGSLVIKGHFELESFAVDGDKTTIDDQLVFSLALANAKANYGRADAGNPIQQMEAMMLGYVAGSHNTRRYIPGRDDRTDRIYVQPRMADPL